MRASSIRVLTFLGAVAISATRPTELVSQGRQAVVTVHVTVPSIVKYVLDASIRTPEGAPTVRLVTNDPAIRAAYARGVTPELAPVHLASATPEQSGHAKGDARLERTTEGARVLRYTVVAP